MKKSLLFATCLTCLLFFSAKTFATQFFFDTFNSYTNGALLGQGPWGQTGATVTSPIQVNSGVVTVGNTGQDVYGAFATPLTNADGATFYIGLSIDVTAAGTGDYFMHYTPNVGNSSVFQERIFVQSSGGGFVLGYQGTSQGPPNYSSTVLNLNTFYRLVLAYTSVPGVTNDTVQFYINPTDTSVEGNNFPYLSSGYVSTGNETNVVAAVNFRQGGGAASAPIVLVDDLIVGTTFGDAAAVPEPAAFALVSLAGLLTLGLRHRNRC